ncbi:hypothetical protein SLW73_03990 [Glutamicibacter protophormiae]|uniref:hypothetical protein n=1 Tax=Glutamicibacter protophormiae TaxID=37930 RepID=UPI002A7F1ED5|nr:hypothetical protein [Glutamicibacter protophormiae]WPR65493.1 hypothetical protein SLW72_03990 [Glutamicibacter protophormiae]WPR68991.1 hypothetical protein SLW73_03990 [Glutamicibacter protophormiae]
MTVYPEQWEREEILSHEAEETPIHVDREWPTLRPEAFHGIAGEIIEGLAPTTEADPVAMLADLLATFGWLAGADEQAAHMLVANSKHHARIWPIIVGTTSSGAKGTSHGAVWRIVAKYLSSTLNPPMHKTGLSSGEGLIEAVRDESGDDPEAKNYEPGVLDKRLFVMEDEIAQVFKRSNREGSTLGPTLRLAYDGRDLSVMNRKAMTATAPHIVIVGHISPGELQSVVRAGDVDGGTMNRFIYICSRRSKRLPDGGNAPQEVVDVSAQLLGEAVNIARTAGQVGMSDLARAHWQRSYARLTADRPDTVLTKATGRRAPSVLRLAMIYCLFDQRTVIEVDDLRAAEALEQYSVDSARYIFESHVDKGSNEHGRLAEFIRSGGVQGKSRAEISIDLYKRNRKSALISTDLAALIEQGSVVQVEMPTDGRKKMVFFAREHSQRTKNT